jgi:hypothetical protein
MQILVFVWRVVTLQCPHVARSRSWVFHDEDGFYQRCLACGERLPYVGGINTPLVLRKSA